DTARVPDDRSSPVRSTGIADYLSAMVNAKGSATGVAGKWSELNVGSCSMGPKSSQSGSSIGHSRDVADIINAKCSAVIATREPFDGQRRGTALKGSLV